MEGPAGPRGVAIGVAAGLGSADVCVVEAGTPLATGVE